MSDDVTAALLKLLNAQYNTVEERDDEYVHKIKKINETIEFADNVVITKLPYPPKWDTRVWDLFTWG